MEAANIASREPEVIAPGRFLGTTNPRQLRTLDILLNCEVSREQLDRVAGASNSPETVRQLRALGLPKGTCLLCEMRRSVDRDGRDVRHGVYSLTAEGRRRVREWIRTEGRSIADMLAAGRA